MKGMPVQWCGANSKRRRTDGERKPNTDTNRNRYGEASTGTSSCSRLCSAT